MRTLAEIDRDSSEPAVAEIDPADFVVVNDWAVVRIGHASDAERELAAAIAERHHQQHRSQTTARRAEA